MSIRINYGETIECANSLSGAARSGELAVRTLKNAISDIEVSWRGASKDAFQTACEKWTVEMNSLIVTLADISQDIVSLANYYKETDERLGESYI